MKKIFYFMSLACMFMFATCSSDDDFNDGSKPGKGEMYAISVGMPGADKTRMDFYENSLTNLVWSKATDPSEKEKITVWKYYSNKYSGNCPTYEIEHADGNENARFTIEMNTTSNWIEKIRYNIVYTSKSTKYDSQNETNSIYNYQGQGQAKVNDLSELKNNIVLSSGLMHVKEIQKSILLKPMSCIFDLNVKDIPAEILACGYTRIDFMLDDVVKASVSLRSSFIKDSKTGNHIYFTFPAGSLKANGGKILFDKATVTKALHWETISEGGDNDQCGDTKVAGYNITFNNAESLNNWTITGGDPNRKSKFEFVEFAGGKSIILQKSLQT